MTSKKDIEGLPDITLLVDEFYARVREDELLGPVFHDRLRDHWEPHLVKMYAFWNAVLFGAVGYVGNPFGSHATLPVNAAHFQQWLFLFNSTIDGLFDGPVANDAKRRGAIMAATFQSRIEAMKGTGKRPLV